MFQKYAGNWNPMIFVFELLAKWHSAILAALFCSALKSNRGISSICLKFFHQKGMEIIVKNSFCGSIPQNFLIWWCMYLKFHPYIFTFLRYEISGWYIIQMLDVLYRIVDTYCNCIKFLTQYCDVVVMVVVVFCVTSLFDVVAICVGAFTDDVLFVAGRF